MGPQLLNGDVDDLLLDLPQVFVPEAQPLHDPRREVLRDDVGYLDELPKQLLAALGLQVEGDAQLLDVVVVEATPLLQPALPVFEGPGAAHDVPAAVVGRILDPNHLGTKCREQACGPSTRQHTAEVADAKAGQRARARIRRQLRHLRHAATPG
jgi:hypothetical protein